MSKEDIDIELIERYLEHELSEQEEVQFESRLQSEPDLRKDLDRIKLLIEGIEYSGSKSSIKSKIEQLEAQLPDVELSPEPSQPVNRMQFLKYAASFAIILGGVWLFQNLFLKPDHDEIFAANFIPYQNTGNGATRGDNEERSPEQLAYSAYDAGEYSEASKQFSALLQDNEDAAMRLYLGNSYLALGELESAKTQFRTLIENDAGLVIQAKWYLGLSYLKNKEVDNARKIFLELSKDGKVYKSKASKILEDL